MLYIGEKVFFLSLFFTFIHVYRDTGVRQVDDYLMQLVLSRVPGIKFRWSGLVTSAFTQSAVSLDQGNIWFYRLKKKGCIHLFILHLFMWGRRMPQHACRNQRTICRIHFSPSVIWTQGSKSGRQTWWKLPFLIEPSWPQCRLLTKLVLQADIDTENPTWDVCKNNMCLFKKFFFFLIN